MLDQEKILEFLKNTGPTLPTKVAKNIDTNILIASAHLADLTSQGKVKISNLKVGGSPLYYLAGQEEELYQYAAGNINGKDLIVLNKLKDKKVLRENSLDLLEKVALRNLKDFAVPLRVNFQGRVEMFWKWHLLSDEETNSVIGEILTPKINAVTEEQKPANKELQTETIEVEEVAQPQAEITHLPHLKAEEVKGREIEADQEEIENDARELLGEVVKEEPKKRKTRVSKKEKQTSLQEEKKEKETEPVEEETSTKEESSEEEKSEVSVKKKEETEEKEESEEKKKPFLQKVKDKISGKKQPLPDNFLPIVDDFFKKLEIEREEENIIRKNTEIDFTVKVPSAVGKMTYFCKAKSKKKCDEKDISAAYMEAQIKKLHLLFLYTNEITPKAQEMLDSGAFENAIIKKIE